MISILMTVVTKMGFSQFAARIIAVLIMFAVIGGTIYAGYAYVCHLTDEVSAAREEAATSKRELVNLSAEFDTFKEDAEKQRQSLVGLTERYTAVQEEVDRHGEIFKTHNWQRLFDKKPGLLLKRFNAGTKRVFGDIETLSGKGFLSIATDASTD